MDLGSCPLAGLFCSFQLTVGSAEQPRGQPALLHVLTCDIWRFV